MKLKIIEHDFSICKVPNCTEININGEYCFIGKTDEEISLVCISSDAPKNATEQSSGWRGFRIDSMLDFSLVGILAKISGILAENEIGIFAVSTFNTDYIFTKDADFKKALSVLKDDGYEIIGKEILGEKII